MEKQSRPELSSGMEKRGITLLRSKDATKHCSRCFQFTVVSFTIWSNQNLSGAAPQYHLNILMSRTPGLKAGQTNLTRCCENGVNGNEMIHDNEQMIPHRIEPTGMSEL